MITIYFTIPEKKWHNDTNICKSLGVNTSGNESVISDFCDKIFNEPIRSVSF